MADREPLPVPDDPLEWIPMRAYTGRTRFEITDPVVEPLWSGTRVLAHVSAATRAGRPTKVMLIEELGTDLAEELPELTRAIGRSVMARDAIVDGVITHQIAFDGVGAAAIPEVRGRPGSMFLRRRVDFDVRAPEGTEDEAAVESDEGFMAVDLLRVDGSDLLDVPLLERKRLLEGVVVPDALVRISTHVQPPISAWIGTWKSMGLRGGILKAANSRYHPNDDSIEWRIVERLGGRG